jgi:hypothetical protein
VILDHSPPADNSVIFQQMSQVRKSAEPGAVHDQQEIAPLRLAVVLQQLAHRTVGWLS